MAKKIKGEYRTKSGLNYFQFSFEQQLDDTVLTYILNTSDYKKRNSRFHLNNCRMNNGRICLDIPHTSKTMGEAFKFAKSWAESVELKFSIDKTSSIEKTELPHSQKQESIEQSVTRFRISEETEAKIRRFLGSFPAERGGMLGRDADKVICRFEPDYTGRCTAGAYDPDIAAMEKRGNRVLRLLPQSSGRSSTPFLL